MAEAVFAPEQCRAARAWLGWTQEQLARAARVGLSTLRDFESGRRVPHPNHLDAIRRAIEDGGMRLLFRAGTAVGVAHKDAGSGPFD
jgi:transcriptional regulator with XRE-family HTH domain